jgi:hydrogenase maturation protease
MSLRIPLLLIGYGNTLRGDDGVGVRVAEAIDALRLPGIHTMVCQQLSPEHADAVSQANCVLFVDAAVGEPREVQFRELEPGHTTQLMTHAADPATLLALALNVFGHAPRAWCVTIPAFEMGFSEELSAEAQRALSQAVEQIRAFAGAM